MFVELSAQLCVTSLLFTFYLTMRCQGVGSNDIRKVSDGRLSEYGPPANGFLKFAGWQIVDLVSGVFAESPRSINLL